MNVALDVLVIIIVAVFAFFGYKKGLIKTVVSIAGTFVASILTMLLSNPIAESIYYGGFDDVIIEKVNDASALFKRSNTGSLMDKLLDTMPKFVVDSMPGFDVTRDKLAAAAIEGPKRVEELLRPIVISFISLIVSIVLFLLISIIIRIIVRVISSKIDNSHIDTINRVIGAVIGIIEGFVLILVIAFIIRIAVPHLKHVPDIISDQSISQSTIFKGIYDSPILTGVVESNTESPNTEAVE